MPINHRHHVHHPGDSHVHEPYIPEFADHSTVTRNAARSGNWDQASTWVEGLVPREGDHVVVDGKRVVCRGPVRFDSLRGVNGGGLVLAPTEDVEIVCSGSRSGMQFVGGYFSAGNPSDPVRRDRKHVVRFEGTIDLDWDPGQFSNGLVVYGGESLVCGSPVGETWVRLANGATAGDQFLTTVHPVADWRPGDRLIIPDSRHLQYETEDVFRDPRWEEAEVDHVDGVKIHLRAPLAYDHPTGEYHKDGLDVVLRPHVMNLTRNIVFESPAGRTGLDRGHTICLGRAAVDWRYAEFRGLGRTRIDLIDVTTWDSEGNPTHTGTNQKGRYPIHLHHCIGPEKGGLPSATDRQFLLRGLSVSDSPKWALSVHDAHFGEVDWCVGYRCDGSIFVSEHGNETGNLWQNCAGFVCYGNRAAGQRAEGDKDDFGYEGSVFWFAGLYRNTLRNLVAANAAGDGINIYGFSHLSMLIPNAPGADPYSPGGAEPYTLERSHTIPTELSDWSFYGCDRAIFFWKHIASEYPVTRPESWAMRHDHVRTAYHGGAWLKDGVFLGDPMIWRRGGINYGFASADPEKITLENTHVLGMHTGVASSGLSRMQVNGGVFDNAHDFYLRTDGSHIDGSGGAQYINADLRGDVKVYKHFVLQPERIGRTDWWSPQATFVTVSEVTYQVYYPEQAPDFVPPASVYAAGGLPLDAAGKMNAQLLAEYGKCFAGELLPPESELVEVPGYAAKVRLHDGTPTPPPPPEPEPPPGPVISDLEVSNVGHTSADVRWTTSEPSQTGMRLLKAGDDAAQDFPFAGQWKTSHKVVFPPNSLLPWTWYEVTARAADQAGHVSQAAVGFRTTGDGPDPEQPDNKPDGGNVPKSKPKK